MERSCSRISALIFNAKGKLLDRPFVGVSISSFANQQHMTGPEPGLAAPPNSPC